MTVAAALSAQPLSSLDNDNKGFLVPTAQFPEWERWCGN